MISYSVPAEAEKLLFEGIILNPRHTSLALPLEIEEAARSVNYVGGCTPKVPVNWRLAEAISAIKGFQGAMVNVLLKRRYGLEYQKITIDTDHATLFITSVLLVSIDPAGENVTIYDRAQISKYISKGDNSGLLQGAAFQTACTNIYRTKDGRFFYLHGGLNSSITQRALGLPTSTATDLTLQEAISMYADKVSRFTSMELETSMNDQHRQAGTTCLSPSEYQDSPQGIANAHVGLYDIHHLPSSNQKPTWWDSCGEIGGDVVGSLRPLSGLKVVDMSRIIAGPAVTRELAELGASVMRITSPNIPDSTDLLIDLGWGKWNAHLDLTTIEDREKLKELIMEADVVVDGYRPGALGKHGFGKDDVLHMVEEREKGLIYARVNCYGWNGPLKGRSGWQQISDANCGTSYEYGRALGADGPVSPIFPHADYSTGAAGATGVLHAIIQRAEKGGSFVVDIALNYYSQWLINTCSVYPTDIWESLRASYPDLKFNFSDSMVFDMATATIRAMSEHSASRNRGPESETQANDSIFREEFFEIRENKAIGKSVNVVKPVLNLVNGTVNLGYKVGFRGNGVDKARWPKDFMTEVVE